MPRANSALKTLFPQKRIEMVDQGNQPFYEWVPKQADFFGRNLELPVRVGPHAGASNTFSNAQAMKGSSNYVHFTLTRKKKYIMVSFDNEALEASERDVGAYMDFKELEIEGALVGIKQQTAADMLGNGSGRIGTVTVVNGNVLTVGEADIVHFEKDMRIVSFAVNTTAGVKTSSGPKGYMVVGSVDPDNNQITLNTTDGDTAAQDGVDATTDKYLAVDGSVGNAMLGVLAWIPSDRTLLATPFQGVTRSDFTSRLGGVYYDGSANGSIAEALERAVARGNKEGSKPEVAWVNYNRFQDLSIDLGARAVREPYKIGNFAYNTIKFVTGNREIAVLADQNFADAECLLATKKSWRFHTLKSAPRALGKGGQGDLILEPAADGWESRWGWYGEMECLSPIDNIRVVLPT
jgi:hypothetical protein